MAEREMSGKALLDKLYSGLDTMPAVQAELNARDLRSLTDDFLGKPADVAASGQHPKRVATAASKQRSPSRARILRSPLAIVFSVALAGTIAAGALRESDKRAALPPPPPAVAAAPELPPPTPAVEAPPPEPVVLVNPFDATEKFTFPPGTSKADAREQMAELLLQRAVERRAHVPRARKLASEPRKSSTGHGS
jgi:hypothetical protein